MSIIEENSGAHSLLEEMKVLKEMQQKLGVNKPINSELWHACAGPLVTLPHVGSLVYYFPQGHSEQVAATTNRIATMQVPSYPNLPSQLLCQVLNATLHADKDTDEIFAQMSLQPLNSEKDVFPIPDIGMKPSKHPSEFFCKTLTPSDTSTHGGFSVPRRAAEKIFPQLDFSMQPPTQELIVRDLHDNTWTFRHIYRGQPKRHLLTTGWSSFVGAKRLKAGDSVIFIRNERSQLMLGIRRANRQQTASPSSVLSADSMQIGVLAAAAHAASNRSPFTIFYNPRYMGIITGISDVDPLRWPGSKWHNLKVEWDEPVCANKQNRVSPWEIESPESLFFFPSLTSIKRPFDFSFVGEQTEWDYILTHPFIRAPQPVNNTGLISPIIQKTLTTPEIVNPQNLVHELPTLSPFSPLKQETWDFQKEVYDCINFEVSNGDSSVVDPSFLSVVMDEFCGFKDGDFGNPSDYLLNNNFSLGQELPANSGGTTSSNGEFNETALMQNGSFQQVGSHPRVRTYTKIQKAGSVGRSIDVSSFKNYEELRCEIERMFGIEGMLNDSIGSGWKLVYLDFENDVLLVGDDPWEEFVGCVRCIRILSPCEVRQMGEEGMQLLNNSTTALQALMTVRHQTPAAV